ncbi:hypothetical protein SLA2020_503680 [Shorea laevis]
MCQMSLWRQNTIGSWIQQKNSTIRYIKYTHNLPFSQTLMIPLGLIEFCGVSRRLITDWKWVYVRVSKDDIEENGNDIQSGVKSVLLRKTESSVKSR